MKRALEIYDEVDIEGAAYSVEEIKEKLRKKIAKAMGYFDGLEPRRDRETIM